MSSSIATESSNGEERPSKRIKTTAGFEAHQYDDGDVVLIASDGVNPVFAHLLETACETPSLASHADKDQISLTDTVLERGKIVQLLLDTVYGTPYRYEWTKQPQYFVDLIKLFDKYDCARCRDSFRRMIGYDAFNGQRYNPRHAFALAAHLNDVSLATKVISAIGVRNTNYYRSEESDLNEHLQNDVALDLGAMSFEAYSRIPPRYTHALLRAALAGMGETDWDLVAHKFSNLMELSCRL